MRLDQITRDVIERCGFRARPQCQLRAENVKKDAAQGGGVDTDSPRSETQTDEGVGRSLRLDDEAEKKLLWARCLQLAETQPSTFPGHIILMRDTGMRNERALPDAHREPGLGNPRDLRADSKTEEGRGAYR